MDTNQSLQTFGIKPNACHLDEIRSILAEQASCAREGRERTEDLAVLAAVQLFASGDLADVESLWAAKQSSMDLGCMLDIQLLCGAGLSETLAFLERAPFPEAEEALEYIRSCMDFGEFEGFQPSIHLDTYRQYFGVA